MERNIDYELIDTQLYKLAEDILIIKNNTIGNLQKKLMRKTFKIGRQERTYEFNIDFITTDILVKAEIASRNDSIFKSINIEKGSRYYIDFIGHNGGLLETKLFGIVVLDIIKYNGNMTTLSITIFSRERLGIHELPLSLVEQAYPFSIESRLNKNGQKTSRKTNHEQQPKSSINSTIESIYHQDFIQSKILYDKSYLPPQTKQVFEGIYNDLGYEEEDTKQLKRSLRNNFIIANNKNIFSAKINQPTNFYQENLFPSIDKKVDYEELTLDYAWEDEICYYYSMAEYLEYELQGGDRMYMTTSFNVGYSNFGAVSEIDTGADNMIWRRKACGDFYVTEQGITIFDRGYQTKLEKLTGLSGYSRRVVPILFSEIETVHGIIAQKIIKIFLTNGQIIGLQKTNLKRQVIPFSDEEMVYLVNLIASLVLNERK